MGKRPLSGRKRIMKTSFKNLLYWMSRLILGAIFIYAGIQKIRSPLQFADNIASYQILPPILVSVLAIGLPPFEIICGLLVLAGFYIRVGALALVIMLSIFSGAVLYATIKGLTISCGCFGDASWLESSPFISLGRDVLLLSLSMVVYSYDFLRARNGDGINLK